MSKTEPLKLTRNYEGLTDVEGEGGVGRGGMMGRVGAAEAFRLL